VRSQNVFKGWAVLRKGRPTAPTVSDPQVCLKPPVPLNFIETVALQEQLEHIGLHLCEVCRRKP
jgi:hypothetical protein